MKTLDSLHRLIKSLTKAEKRYFSLMASRYEKEGGGKEKKNYQALFDAMDRMEEYDEDKLKHKFRHESWINNFASEKRYLFDFLEKSLRNFHTEKGIESRLQMVLEIAELLRNRKLFDRCRRKLKAIKKEATQYEIIHILLKVNAIERKLVKELSLNNQENELKKLIQEKESYLETLQVEQSYLDLYDQISLIARIEYMARSSETLQRIEAIYDTTLLQVSHPNSTFYARRLYHLCRAHFFQLTGNVEAEYNEYQQILRDWEASPHMMSYQRKEYKHALSNYMAVCKKVEKFESYPTIFKKFNAFPARNPDEEGEDFQALFFYQLIYFLNTNQFDAALKLVPLIETGINKHGDKINESRKLSFFINLTLLHFFVEQPSAALHWQRKITQRKASGHRKDLQILAEILEPVLHFELGNTELSQYRNRSVSDKLKRHQRLLSFEKLILTAIKDIVNLLPQNRPQRFSILHQDLLAFKAEKKALLPPGFHDLLVWAESRATNQPMIDLINKD